MAPSIEEMRSHQLTRVVDQVEADLKELGGSEVPRFPERHFREIFLPFFAGDASLPYPVNMSTWVSRVSGTPHVPVNIFSEETGEVLFQVPPMVDRKALSIPPLQLDERGRPMGDLASIVHHAQQLASFSPQQSQRFLSAELTQRALIMKAPASALEFAKAWNAIFKRYGRPPLVDLTQLPGEPSASTPTGSTDEDEYESL